MSKYRKKTQHDYVISLGVFRIGLLLASMYLLQHLFIEPRQSPLFHPIVHAALVLIVCGTIGYIVGFVLWHFRGKRIHKPDSEV